MYYVVLMNNIVILSVQTFVYGDLYRYDVEKNEWKLVSSPNNPPPRSAHQTVAWKNNIYMFGNRISLWVTCCFSVLYMLLTPFPLLIF